MARRFERSGSAIGTPFGALVSHPTYVDAPFWCKQNFNNSWHAVRHCRMSGLQCGLHAPRPVWCSWIGSKSHRRCALQPCVGCWFFRSRLSDLLPLRYLLSQPHQPGSSAYHAFKSASAEPGVPFPVRCQSQPKIAHFCQSKIAHFGLGFVPPDAVLGVSDLM